MNSDSEIFHAFGLRQRHDLTMHLLQGGLCNATHRIDRAGHPEFILQKIKDTFPANLTEDIFCITEHLKIKGWNVPSPIEVNGAHSILVGSDRYRLFPYIEGTEIAQIETAEQARHMGKLLARFHQDLRSCTHAPQGAILGFHDTEKIMKKLAMTASIGDTLAQEILREWRGTEGQRIPLAETSLIHGDPRYQNFLFNGAGRPFTLIDFDTLMIGSVYTDIGDCMRSISCDSQQETPRLNPQLIDSFIEGYRSASDLGILFRQHALEATRQISVELAGRFAVDAYEDNYFGWDKERFRTRKDHNQLRSAAQLGVAKKTGEFLNEKPSDRYGIRRGHRTRRNPSLDP